MSQFFSKGSVRRVEPIIQGNLNKLLSRLRTYQQSGEPVTISLAYSAFTSDIITEYCFGKSYKYLDAADFNIGFYEAMLAVHQMGATIKQFGWILTMMMALPDWLTAVLNPGMASFFKFQKVYKAFTRVIR